METTLTVVLTTILVAGAVVPYVLKHRRREQQARERIESLRTAGLHRPAIMHPQIDALMCIGCGSCVRACPEGDVLAVVDGKAVLAHGAKCVGHGLCTDACPVGAITLALGAPGRNAELPILDGNLQTTVPGIYIAGELGGLGLIRNAVTQGVMAAGHIAQTRTRRPDLTDVAIVGAGPAGLAAALAAKQHGLSYILLEQGDVGGTILHYPRRKLVLTAPVEIPLWGKLRLREVSKEKLLGIWEHIIRETGLEVRTKERVVGIDTDKDAFLLTTTLDRVRAARVILALGRRGTPRTLDVPGEGLPKVMYRLVDAGSFAGTRTLVVGGGDSAVEAAIALAVQKGTSVTLSYRGKEFSRVRERNVANLNKHVRGGTLNIRSESRVVSISPDEVLLSMPAGNEVLPNDFVFVCAGGEMPFAFLKGIGVKFHDQILAA